MATQRKWWRWIGETSPDGGVVGSYEGGGYYKLGIYRPTENSLMRSLGKPLKWGFDEDETLTTDRAFVARPRPATRGPIGVETTLRALTGMTRNSGRIVLEERAALSPDALTGMEANHRFVGPETMETKIFGRLTAWQNWIFIRPNASGPDGALRRYGSGQKGEYNLERV